MMAVKVPTLSAAVAYYGSQPSKEETTQITAPIQMHNAGLDKRILDGWPAFEEALIENHKVYEVYIYPEVNHGFHNNTNPRFDEKAADLSWNRTLEFFKKNLK
jgi:carboxymethylenebutenolidase